MPFAHQVVKWMLLPENILIYSSEIEEGGKKCAIPMYELELRSMLACQLEILISSLSSWKAKNIYLPQSLKKKIDLIGLTTLLAGLGLWAIADPQDNNVKTILKPLKTKQISLCLLKYKFYKRNGGRKKLNQIQNVSSIKSWTCIPDDFPFLRVLFLSCLCFEIIVS